MNLASGSLCIFAQRNSLASLRFNVHTLGTPDEKTAITHKTPGDTRGRATPNKRSRDEGKQNPNTRELKDRRTRNSAKNTTAVATTATTPPPTPTRANDPCPRCQKWRDDPLPIVEKHTEPAPLFSSHVRASLSRNETKRFILKSRHLLTTRTADGNERNLKRSFCRQTSPNKTAPPESEHVG